MLSKAIVSQRAFSWIFNGANKVAVLSRECQLLLEKIGIIPQKIFVTRTMFDGALMASCNISMPSRRRLLFLARFERSKGCYELVEAFGRVVLDFPDVDLVMAGDGGEKDALRAFALSLNLDGRLSFPGYVVGQEKVRLLKECSIFCLPTFCQEGMPVALLEAMAAGKPLLTSNAGGIKDILKDPDNGVLLSNVSADAVEMALRKMLVDDEYCRVTGLRNAEYAWRHFEARQVTSEMEALYKEISCA